MKTIGIMGLGLIGGSVAKAFRKNTDFTVLGYDHSEEVRERALEDGTLDAILSEGKLTACDIVIVCLYPKDTAKYIVNNVHKFRENAIVIDCAGVKTNICTAASKLCFENGIKFIGGHPMAGKEKSGYLYSEAELFARSTMVFCTDEYTDMKVLGKMSELFLDIGFNRITISDAIEHDKIIAFTSQLAHVVSNAYVQSDCAKMQMGFSAGSYKDLTRVAYLNEDMWSELFIENSVALVHEIRGIAERLVEYADSIEEADETRLKDILRTGKEMKIKVG